MFCSKFSASFLFFQIENFAEQKLLIEIFPENSFSLDYQMLAEIVGINHYAFDAINGIIEKSRRLMFNDNCFLNLRAYDISNKLNSVVHDLNIKLFTTSLKDFLFSNLLMFNKSNSKNKTFLSERINLSQCVA
jgi:hypothetical protein